MSDAIDPVKESSWHKPPAQSVARPVYMLRWRTASLVPVSWSIAIVGLCVAIIICAVIIRDTLRDVPVVYSPDTDKLITSTSVRLATDGQLRDYGEYVTALGETWTWQNVVSVGARLENYIHNTMRETARARYAEFATYAKEKLIGRVGSPAGSFIREKTTETAVIVVPYIRHEFTIIGSGKQVYHGGAERVLTLTVVQDLASDTNITGVYLIKREDAARAEYAAKYPDAFEKIVEKGAK
jgi:hypothetical protein